MQAVMQHDYAKDFRTDQKLRDAHHQMIKAQKMSGLNFRRNNQAQTLREHETKRRLRIMNDQEAEACSPRPVAKHRPGYMPCFYPTRRMNTDFDAKLL